MSAQHLLHIKMFGLFKSEFIYEVLLVWKWWKATLFVLQFWGTKAIYCMSLFDCSYNMTCSDTQQLPLSDFLCFCPV